MFFLTILIFNKVSLTGDSYMSVVKGLHNAVALDYHYEKKLVFWTENNLRVIRVAQMNDNNKTGKSSSMEMFYHSKVVHSEHSSYYI